MNRPTRADDTTQAATVRADEHTKGPSGTHGHRQRRTPRNPATTSPAASRKQPLPTPAHTAPPDAADTAAKGDQISGPRGHPNRNPAPRSQNPAPVRQQQELVVVESAAYLKLDRSDAESPLISGRFSVARLELNVIEGILVAASEQRQTPGRQPAAKPLQQCHGQTGAERSAGMTQHNHQRPLIPRGTSSQPAQPVALGAAARRDQSGYMDSGLRCRGHRSSRSARSRRGHRDPLGPRPGPAQDLLRVTAGPGPKGSGSKKPGQRARG